MRITTVGAGYVGLVTGTCLANTGNDVTCLDVDVSRINQLNQGIAPIYEPGLDELIQRNTRAGRLHFTTDMAEAYRGAEVIFICVGTPSDEQGRADLKHVLAASWNIADAIEAAPGSTGGAEWERRAKIVVVKSTVPVGTNRNISHVIRGRTSKPFRMASNPEFLKEGDAINDFNKPDRVVLGVEDEGSGQRLRDLYEPFVRQGNPIFLMDIESAEMVKYAANAMLATKISFINEMANLCEAYGADIDQVRRGMCADRRIGNQFLYPGLGYGGSCFPKDVLACIRMGDQADVDAELLRSVHKVNQQQRQAFIRKIEDHFSSSASMGLAGRRIAVWGIAFKAGTDDIREAPSITVIEYLLRQEATVCAHDPVAQENCRLLLGQRIEYAQDMLACIDQADALVICTDWDEYRHPDLDQIRQRMKCPVIFDGRNLYRTEAMLEYGFSYYSVGRSPVAPIEQESG